MAKEALKRVTLDLPAATWRALKLRAVEDTTSMRKVIMAALAKHLGTTK